MSITVRVEEILNFVLKVNSDATIEVDMASILRAIWASRGHQGSSSSDILAPPNHEVKIIEEPPQGWWRGSGLVTKCPCFF